MSNGPPWEGAATHPVPSSQGVSARMSRQRRLGTEPELQLRRLLHARGLRYRVGHPVPGRRRRTVDIAFTRARVAVFVDGCFWHACPVHGTSPTANGEWWGNKLAGNAARDRDTDIALAVAGWSVLRVWEHVPAKEAAAEVLSLLAAGAAAPLISSASPPDSGKSPPDGLRLERQSYSSLPDRPTG